VAGFPIDLPGRQPVLGFPRWLVRTLEIVVPRRLLVQAVQPEVLRVSRKACLQRVWPAKPLEPGRDLGVVQVRMVTAAWADELEPVGVAAFHPAVHYGHRLAPQAGRLAMAGLAGHRKCHGIPDVTVQPGITGTVLATRSRGDFRTARTPTTGRDSLI
jgi:hypothetical protein